MSITKKYITADELVLNAFKLGVDGRKYIAEFDIDRKKIIGKSWFMDVFSRLGINENHDLMVHSGLLNLRIIIENHADDVNNAILESVGPKGTVIMPSHSGHLTDPHDWT